MASEEKSLWVNIGFEKDGYNSSFLKSVIDELARSGSKISNPDIPPRRSMESYYTRITGARGKAYLYSDLDCISIVGDKPAVEGILIATREHFTSMHIGYFEACNEF
jgi:hypothetical protein